MFLCGTSNFHHMEEEPPAPSTPIRSKKSRRRSRRSNPYSSRGLDKFSSVLSELEARRNRIIARAGSKGVAMVRFTHSDSRDWIPVIVRPRDDMRRLDDKAEALPTEKEEAAAEEELEKEAKGRRWRPSYYMLVVAVVILVCMAVSGRVFAICCTSLWWYLLPKLKGDDACCGIYSERTFLKMREYGRRLSRKWLRRRGGGIGFPAASQAKGMGGVE